MGTPTRFTKETLAFLRRLARNNDRSWFDANRSRYEADVRDPALGFIEEFAPRLARVSTHFHAGPRSLFRINRDTRFSSDKRPYKTHVGIHFRHDMAKDVHAPGYYLHVEPGACYAGLGIWRPDAATLRKVREAIVGDPVGWKKASGGRRLTALLSPDGERLSRPPRGFDPAHPLTEDLKWKDFVVGRDLSDHQVTSPELPGELERSFAAGTSYMAFLCKAVGVPF